VEIGRILKTGFKKGMEVDSSSAIKTNPMVTRNGKIARLPRNTRDELNHRLDEGEPGGRILEWLNALPAVRTLLDAQFGGCRINEQNLSKWRQGGYQDWQKQQERRNLVRQLAENAGELAADADGVEVSNHLSAVLVAELAESAQNTLATITDPAERSVRTREFLHTLARVRREDYLAGRLQIERERRAQERAKEKIGHDVHARFAPLIRLATQSSLRISMGDLYAHPDFNSQALATGYAESLLRGTKPDQAQSN